MDVIVLKSNSSTSPALTRQFFFSDKEMIVLGFKVQSIEQTHNLSSLEGKTGQIDFGSNDMKRKIDVPIFFNARSADHFSLMRDELFSYFNGQTSVYIAETNNARIPITGKVYQVKLINVLDIERIGNAGKITLSFQTTDSPYGRSFLTTQEIQTNGINVDRNWAFGMGLETVDDTELIYTQNIVEGTPFKIFNAGNVDVHPFESYLKLTIKNVRGSTDMVQITNGTNGSRTRINVPVKTTDVWVYDGPNITRNSLAAAKDTLKNFIYLSPGWNTLQIYFCDSAEVSFDFNYLYR